MPQLPKAYTPHDVEGAIYERWLAADVFAPDGAGSTPDPSLPPFTIIQPPPNITGSLHLGHAQRTAVEDLMIRHARMRGHPTLFLPGLDHASIAAQFVLDGILAKEGESRQSLGRERYLGRMREFVATTRELMLSQQRRVGGSFDWGRLRYTMDDGSARAVRVAFKRLYDADLAYRTEALVNWCPGCRTSVSDLEVLSKPETGTLWSVRYHLIDPATGEPDPGPAATITIATTRPETILGDTAVAVHPDDPRYTSLVGRTVRIPFVERDVPIIADDVVDPAFGTGAVKVTPAHDHDDHQTGLRHGLPAPTIIADDASITGTGTRYDGLDRFVAREAIVADLDARGDLIAAIAHEMVLGRCQRSHDVIEPRLKTQWFVRTGPLAARALDATRGGRTRILPERFEKTWEHWLTNIRDWNVSRQLWWGHRIPAWYCPDGHVTVSDEAAGADACAGVCASAHRTDPGPRHLRHLVQLGAVAVVDPRLARRHARPRDLLPDVGHGDGLRHHLLLGRPDDDARPRADREGALPHGLPVGTHPRPARPEDVEDEGQRRRPARRHRHGWRRRAALLGHPRRHARQRPAVRAGQTGAREELRQQTLERHPLRHRCPPGDHPGWRRAAPAGRRPSRPRRPLAAVPGRGDHHGRRRGDGRSCLRRGDTPRVRGDLERILRLGPRDRQGPPRRRETCLPPLGRRRGGRSSRSSTPTFACSTRSCRSSPRPCGRTCRIARRTPSSSSSPAGREWGSATSKRRPESARSSASCPRSGMRVPPPSSRPPTGSRRVSSCPSPSARPSKRCDLPSSGSPARVPSVAN